MNRTFNTIEELIEAGREEAKKAFRRRGGFSGVLCACHCYRREDKIRNSSPLSRCLLLISQEKYDLYAKHTQERFKDPDYEFPYVAVLSPGQIRVRFYGNGQDDYVTKANLCENRSRVEGLLRRHLGKRVRLGKNILVDNKIKEKK